MIGRAIEEELIRQIDYKKVILLFGSRQVGKTTLVKDLVKKAGVGFIYFNGDEIVTRNLWRVDQVSSLIQSFGENKLVILDEAQMIPDVGAICKQIVDRDLGIQLLLTGSSSLNIANLTQEPLTGRKWEHFLYPISCGEIIRHTGVPQLLVDLPQYLVFGSYPEIVTHLSKAKELLNNLAGSYLYKDILALTGVKRPLLLEKILKALAWQIGSEVSMHELSQLVGADAKTIDNYIHLLEQVYVVYRMGAYSGNLRNEISKKKKIYFHDNGIRNALVANFSLPDDRNDIGALWENYLISERKKLLAYHGFYGHSYFWRSKAQAEVDYIEEIDGRLYAYEFKWNAHSKARFPSTFLERYKPVKSEVIHRDNFWQWLQEYPY